MEPCTCSPIVVYHPWLETLRFVKVTWPDNKDIINTLAPFLINFHSMQTEQPLWGMELQEKGKKTARDKREREREREIPKKESAY